MKEIVLVSNWRISCNISSRVKGWLCIRFAPLRKGCSLRTAVVRAGRDNGALAEVGVNGALPETRTFYSPYYS